MAARLFPLLPSLLPFFGLIVLISFFSLGIRSDVRRHLATSNGQRAEEKEQGLGKCIRTYAKYVIY
jgi:hypothetical protein